MHLLALFGDVKSVGDVTESTINEPIPVAGAFLTCQFQGTQTQNTDSIDLSCELNDLDYQAQDVKADFYKTSADGTMLPLNLVSFDPINWRWQLRDKPENLNFTTIIASIAIDGRGPFMFTTELDQNIPLTVFAGYWLPSEPNNNAGMESCTEMVTAQGQENHINFTGLNSGPIEKLNDVPCGIQRNFLCRSLSLEPGVSKWLFTAEAGTFDTYKTACPEGYIFSQPTTAAEIAEVSAVIDGRNPDLLSVWVSIQRNPENPDVFESILD
ncbi:hypothetical protein [Pseudobacteriovorax antillogorgiicola]|uniref:Uncharacterized protein n=2 Tax=Pseudobacteriovorax antillogorgiicola TaxID=1513793 RepID=A0A1Y6BNQ2_9BACT|nr:hypothetical protein [Pseudobacteriovorax antillogorgiicola]TCS55451.1 hypothetical protein EDD56_105172 [Pseudobacteriovorax antillogorgiicola]SMF12322.1 hypothetical protein SAMN06296036_105152 [Pseudobacteriovorax antillogorgiicola]